MNTIAGNDSVTALVRRHDPDRFLTALFAPPDRRNTLMTLYGFNHELARAPEIASQPMLALIRLQWWREVVEGVPKRHEIASPLSDEIAAGRLSPADLLAMVDAREREVEEPFDTFEDWRAWLWRGAGSVSVAAARALGAPEPETFRRFGAAYGGAGLLRSVAILGRAGRCLLPLDLLEAEGLTLEAAIAQAVSGRPSQDSATASGMRQAAAERADVGPKSGAAVVSSTVRASARQAAALIPAMATSPRSTDPAGHHPPTEHAALGCVLSRLANEVASWLGERSRVTPRSAVAAALPGVLARRDLARVQLGWKPRGVSDRLAVVAAAVTGRV